MFYTNVSFQILYTKSLKLVFAYIWQICQMVITWCIVHTPHTPRSDHSTEQTGLIALHAELKPMKNCLRLSNDLFNSYLSIVAYLYFNSLWDRLNNETVTNIPEIWYGFRKHNSEQRNNFIWYVSPQPSSTQTDVLTNSKPNHGLSVLSQSKVRQTPPKSIRLPIIEIFTRSMVHPYIIYTHERWRENKRKEKRRNSKVIMDEMEESNYMRFKKQNEIKKHNSIYIKIKILTFLSASISSGKQQ